MDQRCDTEARGDIHFNRIAMAQGVRQRLLASIADCAERNGKRPDDFVFDQAIVRKDGALILGYDVSRSDGETLSRFETMLGKDEWCVGSG